MPGRRPLTLALDRDERGAAHLFRATSAPESRPKKNPEGF
jgi:hypothetical protein